MLYYSDILHDHDLVYSKLGHLHDGRYSQLNHTHVMDDIIDQDWYLKAEVDALDDALQVNIDGVQGNLTAHENDTDNPHEVHVSQTGAVDKLGDTMSGDLEMSPGHIIISFANQLSFRDSASGILAAVAYQDTNDRIVLGDATQELALNGTFVDALVPIQLPGDPTLDNEAANKQYVDSTTSAHATRTDDPHDVQHAQLADVAGNKTHTVLDAHVDDITTNPHDVLHSQLADNGTNDHAAIDSHIASTLNPHSVTAAQAVAQPTVGAAVEDNIATFDASGNTKDSGFEMLNDIALRSGPFQNGNLVAALTGTTLQGTLSDCSPMN